MTDPVDGRQEGRRQTPIKSSFLGLSKRGTCPVCNEVLDLSLTSSGSYFGILCMNCGEYSETVGDKLQQMDTAAVNPEPVFASATPWIDIIRPLHTTIHFDMTAALAELATTKREGGRLLETTWPVYCCVCGQPATHNESIVDRFRYIQAFRGPFPGPVREITVAAQGIPHCGEHRNGARFDRTQFNNPDRESMLGLLFRSYRYQIEFRKLNQWKWPFEPIQ
jgi:hypothetical protein